MPHSGNKSLLLNTTMRSHAILVPLPLAVGGSVRSAAELARFIRSVLQVCKAPERFSSAVERAVSPRLISRAKTRSQRRVNRALGGKQRC
jgi:hypothetical protein